MGFFNFNKEREPNQEKGNKAVKILKRATLSLLLATASVEAITPFEHADIVKEIDNAKETDGLIKKLKELEQDKTIYAGDIKNRIYFKIKEMVGDDAEKAKQVIHELVDKEKLLSEDSGLIDLLKMVAESEK